MKILSSFCFLTLLALGCSSMQTLRTAADDTLCPTTIEGRFHSRISYGGPAPVISARRHKDYELFLGTILRVDTGGVLFKPQRESSFYSSDSEYFRNDQIAYVVDSAGNLVRGTYPAKKTLLWDMQLELQNDDHPKAEHMTMLLKPNAPFAYCIDAGTWTVTQITFRSEPGFEDVCEQPPPMQIIARKNLVNYVGDLSLDLSPDSLPGVHKLKVNKSTRSGGSWGRYTPVYYGGGALGGAIAGGISSFLVSALGDADFLHTLTVTADTFTTASRAMHPEQSLMVITDTTKGSTSH